MKKGVAQRKGKKGSMERSRRITITYSQEQIRVRNIENSGPVVQEAVPGISSWFYGQKQIGGACGRPEGCVVVWRGKSKAGNESEGHSLARKSWNVEVKWKGNKRMWR